MAVSENYTDEERHVLLMKAKDALNALDVEDVELILNSLTHTQFSGSLRRIGDTILVHNPDKEKWF